ncbi:MAG: hypothetical protein M3421_04340 [Bacteroidota bacterium]|nr:hypothetical protein [Bacteroidota bacterium]
MKRYKKTLLIFNRIFILFFAVFISLFVTFNQSIQQKIEKKVVEIQLPAQEGDEQTPEAQYSFVSSAAITPFSLGVAAASFFILNFIIEKNIYVKPLDASSFYINKYLETLFSRIISPNAP